MKHINTIIILLVILQLAGAAYGSMDSQVHKSHIGPGTANLECATCHGLPPNVVYLIQVQNGSGPGGYIVCEKCHGSKDPMSPSMGNLITIHLSRGTECTGCHDTDTIIPSHPSSNGGQVIKCEKCHPDSEKSVSHVNGGKYCMQCHNVTGTEAISVGSGNEDDYAVSVAVSYGEGGNHTGLETHIKGEAMSVSYAEGSNHTRGELPQPPAIPKSQQGRSIIDWIMSIFGW